MYPASLIKLILFNTLITFFSWLGFSKKAEIKAWDKVRGSVLGITEMSHMARSPSPVNDRVPVELGRFVMSCIACRCAGKQRGCAVVVACGSPLLCGTVLLHSFGIQHDGSSNDCEPVGKRPFIMSPQLLYDTSPLTWSRCSREYITRFLE